MDNKEKKIGEILKGQQFDIDKDALWSNIESSLPKKDQKRRGFWWLFLLLIPISIGAYVFSQGILSNSESKEGIKKLQVEASGSDVVEGVDFQKLSEQEIKNKNEDFSEQRSSKDQLSNLDRGVVLGHEKTKQKQETVAPNTYKAAIILLALHSENQDEILVESDKVLLEVEEMRVKLSSIHSLETEINILTADRPKIQLELRNSLTPTLCCIDQKWSLVLIGGGNKSFSKVVGIEDRESGLYGASLALMLDYKIKNRWSLSGGLGFDQLTSRYIDQREVRSSTNTQGISEIKIDALGKSDPIQGSVEELSISKRDISWHRRQKSIDLLLSLKRDFILSYHWKVGLSGGLAYNLFTETSGFAYRNEENFDFYKFDIDQENYYKNRSGIKPLAGIDLSYRYRNLEILIHANYKWNLEPINTHTEHYQIKHSQTGIQLGTRYYLNGN